MPSLLRSSWGPEAAADLIARDDRRWHEVVNEEVLRKVPLFNDGDMACLAQVITALFSKQVDACEMIFRKGDIGRELCLVARGEVEVLDDAGNVINVLGEGDIFGEIGVLTCTQRSANVRAKSGCNLFLLDKADFSRVLRDNSHFASAVERYSLSSSASALARPN